MSDENRPEVPIRPKDIEPREPKAGTPVGRLRHVRPAPKPTPKDPPPPKKK